MQTDRSRLVSRLETLRTRLGMEMRGRMLPTRAAVKIKNEMATVESAIKELDRDAAERLALEKAPIDEVLEIVAIPLLADVMNDLVAGVDGMLRRNGCQETVFGDYVRTIRRAALAMVDTLDMAEGNMPKLLDVDDALVDAVKKKLMSFIKQRLNIKK